MILQKRAFIGYMPWTLYYHNECVRIHILYIYNNYIDFSLTGYFVTEGSKFRNGSFITFFDLSIICCCTNVIYMCEIPVEWAIKGYKI